MMEIRSPRPGPSPVWIGLAVLAFSGLAFLGCPQPTVQPPDPLLPVAEALVESIDDAGHTTLRTTARHVMGSTVQLDGTGSYDPEHPDDGYERLVFEWAFYERPTGSVAELSTPHQLPDSSQPDTARPTFVPDVTGTYRLSLQVTNPEEDVVSELDYVTVGATVPQNLQFDLYWATPATDLDLHLIGHRGTYWEDSDCFFANPAPDWGESGCGTDNPQLVEDDDNGGEQTSPGHERITLPDPPDGTYTVVVVHHSDHRSGEEVIPWLTITADGEELVSGEECPTPLADQAAWIALEIDTPDMTVRSVDTMTSHTGLGGPAVNE